MGQAFIILAVVCGIPGCEQDPLQPEDLVGNYPLTQVNGTWLPFLVDEGPSCTTLQGNTGSYSLQLVSGEFRSRTPGTWVVLFEYRATCTSSPGDTDVSEHGTVSNGRYELEGNAITLIDVFRGEETLYATGRASRSTLALTLEPQWGGYSLTFVRQTS